MPTDHAELPAIRPAAKPPALKWNANGSWSIPLSGLSSKEELSTNIRIFAVLMGAVGMPRSLEVEAFSQFCDETGIARFWKDRTRTEFPRSQTAWLALMGQAQNFDPRHWLDGQIPIRDVFAFIGGKMGLFQNDGETKAVNQSSERKMNSTRAALEREKQTVELCRVPNPADPNDRETRCRLLREAQANVMAIYFADAPAGRFKKQWINPNVRDPHNDLQWDWKNLAVAMKAAGEPVRSIEGIFASGPHTPAILDGAGRALTVRSNPPFEQFIPLALDVLHVMIDNVVDDTDEEIVQPPGAPTWLPISDLASLLRIPRAVLRGDPELEFDAFEKRIRRLRDRLRQSNNGKDDPGFVKRIEDGGGKKPQLMFCVQRVIAEEKKKRS